AFFFSSRRRHTRFSRDWSSDVCSSDLPFFPPVVRAIEQAAAGRDTDVLLADAGVDGMAEPALIERLRAQVDGLLIASPRTSSAEIGRASCRESVRIRVAPGVWKRASGD